MDAVKFMLERERMCESNYDRETECKYCVAHDSCEDRTKCKALMLNDKNIKTKTDFMIAVSIVEKWSKEHPRKTRLQDFLEKFPHAPLENGIPERICPYDFGYKVEECFGDDDCEKCWNHPIE